MRFTIRPNSEHPDWPTEPDPDILAQMLDAAKNKAEKKAAPALALIATQKRAAAKVRKGCYSDNLDWLAMVAQLRQELRTDTPDLFAGAWIDTSPPKEVTKTFEVEASVREGAVRRFGDRPRGYQYRYVTIEVIHD